MRKLFVAVSLVILVGIGVLGFLIIREQQRSSTGDQSALPAYGEALVSNQPGSQGLDVLGQSSQQGKAAPSSAELKSYEKYQNEKSILQGEIKAGTGAKAETGKKVAVAYTGYLTNGTVFDKTTDKAFGFLIGERKVIPGFEQGVIGMQVGGKRRLIIPPALGYGAQAQGQIPANSILVFDIELLAVQ